ncbi:hypothetical protein [Brevibacillus sp. NL20B1]|uniref:hypothetical protein n=1 Tax=Brevibacillus sp. NL20B1 TaxID=2829799 RepID=UPI001B9E20EF|nr:hypothetical protein [Brevibacillus sp. NL20B1]MBR8659699.1 hypothetical protein [Brevibacillus sp. NL20B1]
MNKKLVLSVLSTAVVASMAASAMAKPDAGFYVGGQVDKYYNIDAFFNHFDEALDEIVDNLDSTTYVDADGNAASFQDILTANGDLSKVMKPASLDHFEKNPYAIVDGTGSYNPEEDEDLLPVDEGELKVESVSAIHLAQFVIKFGAPVDKASATDPASYKFDGAALNGTIVLSSDKKTATVTLATPVTNNTYHTVEVLDSTIKADGSITDYVPAKTEAVLFNDTTKPEVKDSVYSPDGEIYKLTFSEPVKTLGTINVYDENNQVVATQNDFTLASDKLSATLDTSASGINLAANKTYRVVMVGAKDLADNFFANNRVEKTFKKEKTDTVAPNVVSVTVVNSTTVRVAFNEAVQVDATTGKVADITVDGGTTTDLKVVDTTPTAVGEAIEVTPGTVFDVRVSNTPLTGAHTISINNFKDLQGNAVTTPVVKNFQVNADTTPANLTKTEAANKVVTLTFDEDVTLGTSPSATLVTPDNVEIAVGSAAFQTVTTNSKQIKVDLSSVVTTPVVGNYQLKIASGSIQDTAATPNTKDYTATFALTADTTKPTVTAVTVQGTYGNDVVVVAYSEDMGASALDVNNYLVDGQKVFESAVFSSNKQTVKLTLKPGVFDITGDRVLTIENVADLAGNKIDKYTGTAETYNENVKPVITKAELLGLDKIVLTFSESVDNVDDTDFEVYTDGASTPQAITVAPQGTSDSVYEITLSTAITDLSKEVTLKVLSSNDIVDKPAGNKLATSGKVSVEQ